MKLLKRILLPAAALALAGVAAAAHADAAPFDLTGPEISVSVTHDGLTLPIDWVPNLAAGDRVSVKLVLPKDQSVRYRLIAAFLRGATDKPPKSWFFDAKTWEKNGNNLSLTVPAGAGQLVLFVMPDDHGDVGAVIDAVRRQPGTFVRATQELNQASLDRARLDTFLATMRHLESEDPGRIADASKDLTRSLAIKLKQECLQQPADMQAACLTQDRDTLLLADTHTSALAATLTGTPTDLAFQAAATPQANFGYYSPYIGIIRDVVQMFGAFRSTQLQYIPALSRMHDGRVTLLLNTPMSFGKPTSVMVAALPAIEPPKLPPLRRAGPEGALCAATGLVLPVEGAPLVYATNYARNVVLRVARPGGGSVDVPLHADAEEGGYVTGTTGVPLAGMGKTIRGQLHGSWGFARFDGPSFTLSNPEASQWQVADGSSAVTGRDDAIQLSGGALGCLSGIEMKRPDGSLQTIKWKASGADNISLTLPLTDAKPGPLTLLLHVVGRAEPQTVTVRAVAEIGKIDGFELHAGDAAGVLSGTRLDQVTGLTLGGIAFAPGAVTRVGDSDRLTLTATDAKAAAALPAGRKIDGEVTFAGDRHKHLSVTVAPPRPSATLIALSAQVPHRDGVLSLALSDPKVIPAEARLTFSFRDGGDAPLTGKEQIEVATADGRASTQIAAGAGYDLQSGQVGIVSLTPAQALGATAYGPLRFRVVRDGVAGDWTPLGTLVRLPDIETAACAKDRCTLGGGKLFLIDSVAGDAAFAKPTAVPDGFTGATIEVPAPAAGTTLYLRLRDDPRAVASVGVEKTPS